MKTATARKMTVRPAADHRDEGSDATTVAYAAIVVNGHRNTTAVHRTTRATRATYGGVAVPSGLLKPPGRSSSSVATKPFTRIARTIIGKATRNGRSVHADTRTARIALTIRKRTRSRIVCGSGGLNEVRTSYPGRSGTSRSVNPVSPGTRFPICPGCQLGLTVPADFSDVWSLFEPIVQAL